jgi:hypothetical protein
MLSDNNDCNSDAPVKREQELHESWWEFACEFSQLSCPGQTRTRVAWELRSESLHESFLNSRALVKREQELYESWWELRSESLHQSFLNSHVPVKREQDCMRVDENWEARVCMRVFSTPMPQSNENKSCMRVDESWEARVCIGVAGWLVPGKHSYKPSCHSDTTKTKLTLLVYLSWTAQSNIACSPEIVFVIDQGPSAICFSLRISACGLF